MNWPFVNIDWRELLTWRDLADIAVVALFLYIFLILIRGTRAVQILQGLVVLLLLMALFYMLKLQTIYFLLRALVLSIVVALPIVFQPELRRALMQLGARSIISPFSHVSRDVLVKIIDEISWAASILSQTRYGALMVVERETGLEEYIETGVKVNGEVSSKLLLSIFIPRSPLHDGAAILRGDKVVAASCYLPLSEAPPSKDRNYGTRHRAAIGLSEQTDAIVVVVSEETGSISIAKDGKLISNIDEETLKKSLLALIAPPARPAPPSVVRAPVSLRDWLHRWFQPPEEASGIETGGLAPPPPRPPTVRLTPSAVPEALVPELDPTREMPTPVLETPAPTAPPPPAGEPVPDEAEAQRLEEAVQKRAEEAKRRQAEKEAHKAEEERKDKDDPPEGQVA